MEASEAKAETEAKTESKAEATGTEPKTKAKSKPMFSKVKEITPNELRRGWNLVVKVLDNPEVVIDRQYLDGVRIRIAHVTVGDESGTVRVRLRDDQITQVKKDDVIILRNVSLRMRKHKIHVIVSQWGLIDVVEASRFEGAVNTEHNVSDIEWELVDSKDVNDKGKGQTRGRGNK